MEDEFHYFFLVSKKNTENRKPNIVYIYRFIFFSLFFGCNEEHWSALARQRRSRDRSQELYSSCVVLQCLIDWQLDMQDTKWFDFSESVRLWMPASWAFRGTDDVIWVHCIM